MGQQFYYSDERNILILISLLKQNGIKKVIVSPGATNVSFVGSLQNDPFFEMYSCIDERSAAYMACGLAAESGEPVVISCTGATSSRNYMPALTEAYYRKLPILAVTSTQDIRRVGHMIAQVTDRSVKPNDVLVHAEYVPSCSDETSEWDATIRLNRAILALSHHGGGPVHINLATRYSRNFSVRDLPVARLIKRYTMVDILPEITQGQIAIFVGSHIAWNKTLVNAVECFCTKYGAVVFCDHSSNYKGKFRVCNALVGSQAAYHSSIYKIDLLIHIGEISGHYAELSRMGGAKQVWRINEDGELRDPFHRLTCVYEMNEEAFFVYYVSNVAEIAETNEYLAACQSEYKKLHNLIPDLPFSNVWLAQKSAPMLPENSVLHLGILNSLRTWNLFEIPQSVTSYVNAGGFGIDGVLSTCIGGTLAQPDKLHFVVIGDLAFFYDMNVMGNRHITPNLRILLVNNGKGTEFRNYNHYAAIFNDEADKYMAAGGHYGNKSNTLVRHLAEDLGFEYYAATNKDEYVTYAKSFFLPPHLLKNKKPLLLEVFTDSQEESDALYCVEHLIVDNSLKEKVKKAVKKIVPQPVINTMKNLLT